ncbi:MAG TPA: aldehyde dehydrogenase [Candidatus Spyradocola merdavium]|nr:aldehyde dehydrogenase [Candidatus Spyradocola merdavium]
MDFSDMRAYFEAGRTLDPAARIESLRALEAAIRASEGEICQALQADLGKAPLEAYMTEIGMVLEELRYQIRHVRAFSRPRRVRTPLMHFPAVSRVYPEPYGLVLVMAPWNYPFQLSLEPLIGALAAGNCVVLKPSNYAPHTARAMEALLTRALPRELVRVVQGGRKENAALLDTRFDSIFFTGGRTVGRLVMEKAAQFLTPVTLELGGKSPVLVLEDADIDLAARRIAFGKLLNAGQTCVAPDYVLVQRAAREPLIAALKREFRRMLGEEPLKNPEYPRIVNEKHFARLQGLLAGGEILCGGRTEGLRMEPTLLLAEGRAAPAMREEIFGPILPILTMDGLPQMIRFVRADEKPLALYLFTRSRAAQREVLGSLSFGGGCVNDTIIHLATTEMGFGGVGASGMGAYHGRKSFDTFTHEKSVVHRGAFPDVDARYHPYTEKKEKLVRSLLH